MSDNSFTMKKRDESAPVEVFAGTQWETSMVRSLLEAEGIEVFLMDEVIGTLTPWYASPGGAAPIKVFVSGTDEERALGIVKEYIKNAAQK